MSILKWIIKHLAAVAVSVMIIIVVCVVIYMGVEFKNTSDDYTYLNTGGNDISGSKEQFYEEYITQKEANQEAVADGTLDLTTINGATGSTPSSLSLSATAEQIKSKLEANSTYSSKAYCLSLMYQVLTEDFNMSSACAVGFMANVQNEGDVRLVEKMFSTRNHDSNGKQVNYYADGTFQLPSGSTTFNTMADVDYLYNWTTDSTSEFKYYNSSGELKNVYIGSCGVSCVQWSFNRRLTYLDILKGVVTSNGGDVSNSSQVISDDWAAEAVSAMVKEELTGDYSESLTTYAIDESLYNTSNQEVLAGEWAKVFCYHYEKPGETDAQATARAKIAIDMYSYLFE